MTVRWVLGVERRVQKLVERGRVDPLDRLFAVDHASAARSTEILRAAAAVRLPVRVCSM